MFMQDGTRIQLLSNGQFRLTTVSVEMMPPEDLLSMLGEEYGLENIIDLAMELIRKRDEDEDDPDLYRNDID